MTSLITSGAVFCLIFLLTGLYKFWYSINRLRQKEDKECMKKDFVFVCEKVKINGKEYYLDCDSILIT